MKRTIFRLLTLAAIIFAAGISGAWLADQFTAPLPQAWGFFGALIIGVAIYGGVMLGTQGDRAGYVIAGLGAVAEVTFGFWYFAHGHDAFTALVLGIVPTGIAIVSGLVENTADNQAHAQAQAQAHAERQADIEDEERTFAHRIEAQRLELEHAERLARIEANAQARIAVAQAQTIQPTTDPAPKTVPFPAETGTPPAQKIERPQRLQWLTTQNHVTVEDLVNAWGVGERQVRKDLQEIGFSRNGDGRWHK